MGLREDITRRIERKKAEIAELQAQVRLAQEYLQALEDTMRLVPREFGNGPANQPSVPPALRPGSLLAKAREAILVAGRPMYVTDLLTAIGKGTSRNDRAGLSGTLAAYVRRGEVFTRPAPNTFGLVEMPATAQAELSAEAQPPAGFGAALPKFLDEEEDS